MPYLLSININNIAAIGGIVSHGHFLTKQGTKVLITWPMMREMVGLVKVRQKISSHLRHLPVSIQKEQYDDVWQFDHASGIIFQPDFSRNCIQMRLPDGNCVEIDIPILLELNRRYDRISFV